MAVWPNGLRTKPDFTSLYLGYPGHYGLDMKNFDINYAVLGGTVVTSGWSPLGGGYMVEILADNGDLHRYLHNAKGLLVVKGQRVETGQAVAYQGNSGLSTGKHLHFAVRLGGIGGRYTDPLPYLEALVGSTPASTGTTKLEEEEDMPQYDLIQSDDNTVWWCVDRVLRYAIPNQAALDTYKVFYKQKTNFTAKVVKKSDAQAEAYGSPVYSNPLNRYATPKNVTDATTDILAAVGTGGTGGSSGSVNLQPVLDAVTAIPAATIKLMPKTGTINLS